MGMYLPCTSAGDFKDLTHNWCKGQSLLSLQERREANPGENPGGNSLSQGDRDPSGSMAQREDAEEGARNTKA